MFARENYYKNEKVYLAKFVQANPKLVAARLEQGKGVSLEEMSADIQQYLGKLRKKDKMKFYLQDPAPPKKMNALELTLLWGIVFFGVVVTGMTLIWGLL